jgi:hypothetical protein
MQHRRSFVAVWLALFCLVSNPAPAADSEGPMLWRVGHGDHQLVVLGSLVPLPTRVSWNQGPITAHLAGSDVLLEPPGVELEGGLSWLGTLWRLPTLLRARNNPAEGTLDDVLPSELWQRWERQRTVFLAGQRSIGRRRPIVAADALQQRAMQAYGLELENQVAEQMSRLARRRGVARIDTAVPLSLDAVNAFLDAVAQQPLDDLVCFEKVLARVEAGPEQLRARAEFWRAGMLSDLQTQPLGDTLAICSQALLGHPAAHAHGIDDLPERARQRWLEIAEQTLHTHRRSVAVLPLSLVLGESGYLAELQRRGFTVEPSVRSVSEPADSTQLSQR